MQQVMMFIYHKMEHILENLKEIALIWKFMLFYQMAIQFLKVMMAVQQ